MSGPLTPMEQGGTWATHTEADAFLDACAASGRVSTMTPGTASDGTALRVVVVAEAPAALSDAQVVIVAAQHGTEVAGREAAMRLVRDLAFSAQPPPVPVAVMPTANPWGVTNASRFNATGADINRSHVSLSTPEARAIATVTRAVDPLLVYDGHETSVVSTQVNIKTVEYTASPAYRAWSDAVEPAALANFPGQTTASYPERDHEGTLVNAGACRGVPSVLIETLVSEPAVDRVGWHLTLMNWFLGHVAENAADLAAIRTDSDAWARGEGFAAHVPVFLYEGSYQQAPVGYRIRYGDVPWALLADHGIATADRTSWGHDQYVPMDQSAYALIPWLLDPRGPRPVAPAIPVFPGDEPVVDLSVDRFHEPRLLSVAGVPARRMVAGGGIVWGT